MKQGVSKELAHLVNLKLEGNLNATEQQRLAYLLSDSENARNYLRQMEELDAHLRSTSQWSPQSDISQQVIQRIGEAQQKQKHIRTISLAGNFRTNAPALLRYAAILLIGLMVGSALTMIISTGRFSADRQAVVGSMGGRTTQAMSFGDDDWQLQLNSMVVDQTITLVITAYASVEIQTNISFDQGAYSLIKAGDTSSKPNQVPTVSGNELMFHIKGNERYFMILQQQAVIPMPPLHLNVVKNGSLVLQQEINLF